MWEAFSLDSSATSTAPGGAVLPVRGERAHPRGSACGVLPLRRVQGETVTWVEST